MASVTVSKKACSVNPLKMSQPIGGALAFMGVRGAMPLLHGSQGCTSFGLVLFVRHFKEAIPLQTTAMNEVATVLGGYDNVEQAILNIYKRAKPEIIGICSTGVTETKGDDVDGYHQADPRKASGARASADRLCLDAGLQGRVPGRLGQDGDADGRDAGRGAEERRARAIPQRVNVLPGCHLTPGDIDELRDIIEDFGLGADLPARSLRFARRPHPGRLHADDDRRRRRRRNRGDGAGRPGRSRSASRCGAPPRRCRSETGVPFRLFDRLTGLERQ